MLKTEQSSLLKFPVSPLSCSLGPPLGSALLPGPPGLGVGSASHHLPLDLHLRGKLEPGAEALSKTKKGRRSRTVFTELQLMGLEKRFEKQKYLSTPDRLGHTKPILYYYSVHILGVIMLFYVMFFFFLSDIAYILLHYILINPYNSVMVLSFVKSQAKI